jgi:glycosyltransferase involved in cell wall biosynthesis
MRILHVTTFLQGGAGRVIASLAVAQRRAGHEVLVAADAGGEPGYSSYREYLDHLAGEGIPLHRLQSTFKRDIALNVRAAAELRSIVRDSPVDIAHTHAAIPSLVARLALSGLRAPVLQTMHGWGIAKTREHAVMDIALLGLVDAVVTPSAAARAFLAGEGLDARAVRVIPYGIGHDSTGAAPDPGDAALFERLRRHQRRIALCIGTIGERKNQRLLVSALSEALLRDVDAVFIGDGDAGGLRAYASECGVASRVHVLGYRVEASRYLAFADAFVLPSRNEGLPVALLESIRAGVPVVASAIPAISEVMEADALGHVFDPGSTTALAAALGRTLEQDSAVERRRLMDVFERRYLHERMTAAYMQAYEDVIDAGRASMTTAGS